jgi:hypothetical protein
LNNSGHQSPDDLGSKDPIRLTRDSLEVGDYPDTVDLLRLRGDHGPDQKVVVEMRYWPDTVRFRLLEVFNAYVPKGYDIRAVKEICSSLLEMVLSDLSPNDMVFLANLLEVWMTTKPSQDEI